MAKSGESLSAKAALGLVVAATGVGAGDPIAGFVRQPEISRDRRRLIKK